MGKPRRNKLPKYLEFNSRTRSYYYKNPGMQRKAGFGKDAKTAIDVAKVLNSKYRIQAEQRATRLEAAVDFGSPPFEAALIDFVEKYIVDYRIKSSTAALLRQRRQRLTKQLGEVQVAAINTQLLREAIECNSQFEQSKMKTLLVRFFRYAKSTGTYPCHLANPVDDLFVDPVPNKQRHRMTMAQFRAVYSAAPRWMQWLMTLAFHLTLRRVDLVLSSHLYARAGYEVSSVQHLMAHTDPDMTRAYQKGHARKVLRVDMLLPFSVDDDDRTVREELPAYVPAVPKGRQEKFSENFLTKIRLVA